MFKFEHPELLFLLVMLLAAIPLSRWLFARSQRKLALLGNSSRLEQNVESDKRLFKIDWILWSCFWVFLILAIANPQFGKKKQNVQATDAELIFLLDVSNSMLASDIKPDRISRAQLLIKQITEQLPMGKTGLIAFAGEAYLQSPLTSDLATIQWMTQLLKPEDFPSQGTDIGAAIKMGIQSFPKQEGYHKLMILITDGEDHEGQAMEQAKIAASSGITIITIPMGTPEGAPVPDNKPGSGGFKYNTDGKPVISKPNRDFLDQLASETGGVMLEMNSMQDLMDGIRAKIKHVIRKDLSFQVYNEFESRYQWPLMIAFIILMILLVKPYVQKNIDL